MEILRVETCALVGIGYRAVSHSRYAVPSLGDLERYSGASQGTPVGRYSRRPLRGAPAGRKTLRERRPTRANRRGDADGEEKKRDGRAWAQARCHDKFVVSAAVPSCDGSRGRSLPTTLGPHVRQSGGPKWWDASCLLQLDSACCRSDNISDGHAVPGGVPEQWYRSASVIHKDLATHQNGT